VAIAFDAKFPTIVQYENPLVGLMQNKRDTSFNFVMLNGDTTQYPCVDIKLAETIIPDGTEIRRVRLREYNDIEASK